MTTAALFTSVVGAAGLDHCTLIKRRAPGPFQFQMFPDLPHTTRQQPETSHEPRQQGSDNEHAHTKPLPREVNDCTTSINSGIIKNQLIHCILPSTGIFSNGWVLLLVVVLGVRDTDAALNGVRVGMLGLEGVVVVLCRVTGLWRCVARMPC